MLLKTTHPMFPSIRALGESTCSVDRLMSKNFRFYAPESLKSMEVGLTRISTCSCTKANEI